LSAAAPHKITNGNVTLHPVDSNVIASKTHRRAAAKSQMRAGHTEKYKIAVSRSNVTIERRFLVFRPENGRKRHFFLVAPQKFLYNRPNTRTKQKFQERLETRTT